MFLISLLISISAQNGVHSKDWKITIPSEYANETTYPRKYSLQNVAIKISATAIKIYENHTGVLIRDYVAPTGQSIKNFEVFDGHLSVVVYDNTNIRNFGSDMMRLDG